MLKIWGHNFQMAIVTGNSSSCSRKRCSCIYIPLILAGNTTFSCWEIERKESFWIFTEHFHLYHFSSGRQCHSKTTKYSTRLFQMKSFDRGDLLLTSLLLDITAIALPLITTVKIQCSVLFVQVWHTTACGYMTVLGILKHCWQKLIQDNRLAAVVGNIRGKLFSDSTKSLLRIYYACDYIQPYGGIQRQITSENDIRA